MNKAVVILFLLCHFRLISQSDYISQIRDHYKKLNEQIALCHKLPNEECSLYSNEITINNNKKMWRAVGNYQQKLTFWYIDEPGFAELEGKNESNVLQKIIIQRESAAINEYEEWLFKDGALQFFYIKQLNDSPNNNIEARYYFNEGKLIKTIISEESKNYYSFEANIIKEKSTKLIQLFLKTFDI